MNPTVHSLGAIPIAIYKTENFLTDDEKNYIMNSLSYREINESGTNYITNDSYVLTDTNLLNVRSKCQQYLEKYTKELLKIANDFQITNSWCVKSPTGGSHHAHPHPNSIYSAVYYVEATSADVIFEFEALYSYYHRFQYIHIENNEFNATKFKVSPRTGDLLIFPSWIMHQVTENTSKEDRVVLAFNSFVSGLLGSSLKNTMLNLEINM